MALIVTSGVSGHVAAMCWNQLSASRCSAWAGSPGPMYMSGGTWRALASFARAQIDFPLTDPHGFTLLPDDAQRLAKELVGADPEKLMEISGISEMRAHYLPDAAALLRPLLDAAKQRLGSGVAAICATNDGKAAFAVAVTDDLTDRFSAVELVRAGVAALGGKGGGGRPDMAQGGGPDAANAGAALDAVRGALAEAVNA